MLRFVTESLLARLLPFDFIIKDYHISDLPDKQFGIAIATS
jgi:hypothetical protein